jgi:N-acetylglucosaminyl-diphospho-decaprenol L-rhamnosyltransferase
MISLLVVNYRSAPLAIEAIRSARAASAEPLQVVVVDNSLDPAEVERLRGVADEVSAPARNTGYAGGINLGRRSCRGEIFIACNPDVEFAPRAIDALAAAVRENDAAAAGPALYWDRAHEWHLPPADDPTLAFKADEILASRMQPWFAWRDRRRFRERVRFWSLASTTVVPSISGAVMAIRARDFDAIGGFDERFELYFEETDFLRRLRRRGKKILYVPAARCRHLYNQSAGGEAENAARRYDESQRRFAAKWYGSSVAWVLRRLEQPAPSSPLAGTEDPLAMTGPGVVIEASPLASFATAAGCFPAGPMADLPSEVWRSYRSDVLYLRAVQKDTGRILAAAARRRVDRMTP